MKSEDEDISEAIIRLLKKKSRLVECAGLWSDIPDEELEDIDMGEKELPMNQIAPLLEEYKSLRTEILERQNTRLHILGFTMAAIGTILGFALRDNVSIGQELNWYVFALVSFALVILNAALILTIQHTQQIDVISAYIRKFIEPKIGIGWETRWTRYRELKKSGKRSSGLPLGTSKPLTLFYAFMTLAVYSVAFVTNLYRYPLALILVTILVVSSLMCSYDLYKRKTKGWKINWEVLDEQH